MKKSIAFKRKKIPLLCFLIILGITCFSFYQYYRTYLAGTTYYKTKNTCTKEETKDSPICARFQDQKHLEAFLEANDPAKRYDRLDTITLTCEIVENNAYNILQILSPLIVIVAVVGKIHPEIKSGSFKNYLMRMNYKDYLKKNIKEVFKIAGMIPLSLLLIFLTSAIIMKFDFSLHESVKGLAVYGEWKYQHFFLYGTFICLFQYLLGVIYGVIALFSCYKNKNSLVAVISAYIGYLIVYFGLYIIVYSLFINKILGLKGLTEYFNISGYWFFNQDMNYLLILLILVIVLSILFAALYHFLKKKERIMMENEKQNS